MHQDHVNHSPESPSNTPAQDDHNSTNPVSASQISSNEDDATEGEHIDDHNHAAIELPLRIRQPPQHLKDFHCYNVHPNIKYPISDFVHYNFSQNHKAYLAAISNTKEPISYTQASKLQVWRDAMAQELQALEDNQTWELTTLPPDKKLIDCRWVYNIKHKATGEIEKHKARLVAKGFTQTKGENFHETFAPIAKMTTVRCLLTVAAINNGSSIKWMLAMLSFMAI